MEELLKLLVEKHLTIGSAESMTGGLFASSFTSIPGASKAFLGSVVTYSMVEKVKLLHVNPVTIVDHGIVSEEVAKEMAKGGRKLLGVDICVSITGNAGPTTEPGGQPVGRYYIGLATKNGAKVFQGDGTGDRNQIRNEALLQILSILKSEI